MWRNKHDSLADNARLLLSSGFLALIHACRGSMSNWFNTIYSSLQNYVLCLCNIMYFKNAKHNSTRM